MRNFIKYVSFGVVLALSLSTSALAFSVTMTPLHRHAATVAVVAGCNVPAVAAALNGEAFYQVPTIAALQGATGSSIVLIQLSQTGALQSASIAESSGNPNLDRAALQSARMSRFSPEISGCAAVGGSYLYKVTF